MFGKGHYVLEVVRLSDEFALGRGISRVRNTLYTETIVTVVVPVSSVSYFLFIGVFKHGPETMVVSIRFTEWHVFHLFWRSVLLHMRLSKARNMLVD